MMNCNDIDKNLELFSRQIFVGDEKQELETHLNRCASCRKKYMMALSLERIIVAEKSEKVNPFLSTRIISKWQEAEKESSKSTFKNRVLQPVLIGAMMLAGVAIGLVFALNYTESSADKTLRELSYYMDGVHQEKIETLLLEL